MVKIHNCGDHGCQDRRDYDSQIGGVTDKWEEVEDVKHCPGECYHPKTGKCKSQTSEYSFLITFQAVIVKGEPKEERGHDERTEVVEKGGT